MNSKNDDHHLLYSKIKVVFLGDRAVGKSSLIQRFITNHFQENIQPTVGVDFLGKNLVYKNRNYRIQLWDTAGQQKYRSLVRGYLKGADACVLVYDLSSPNTFVNLSQWLQLFDSVANPNSIKIIASNKCDKQYYKAQLQKIKQAMYIDHSQLKKIQELETSARIGVNVEELFEKILDKYEGGRIGNKERNTFKKMLDNFKKQSKNSCCK